MNVLVGEDANFRSGGNNVKMSLMTRKNRFNEIGRIWRSDAGYVGIAQAHPEKCPGHPEEYE
jgi:hypothetical protein